MGWLELQDRLALEVARVRSISMNLTSALTTGEFRSCFGQVFTPDELVTMLDPRGLLEPDGRELDRLAVVREAAGFPSAVWDVRMTVLERALGLSPLGVPVELRRFCSGDLYCSVLGPMDYEDRRRPPRPGDLTWQVWVEGPMRLTRATRGRPKVDLSASCAHECMDAVDTPCTVFARTPEEALHTALGQLMTAGWNARQVGLAEPQAPEPTAGRLDRPAPEVARWPIEPPHDFMSPASELLARLGVPHEVRYGTSVSELRMSCPAAEADHWLGTVPDALMDRGVRVVHASYGVGDSDGTSRLVALCLPPGELVGPPRRPNAKRAIGAVAHALSRGPAEGMTVLDACREFEETCGEQEKRLRRGTPPRDRQWARDFQPDATHPRPITTRHLWCDYSPYVGVLWDRLPGPGLRLRVGWKKLLEEWGVYVLPWGKLPVGAYGMDTL